MAIKAKDVYRGRQKSHKTAWTIVIIAVVLLAAAIGLFYGLRHYVVYDGDGNATIVLPFSQQTEESSPAPAK